VSILSFDSGADVDAAFASDEWKAAVAQVGDMRGRRIAVLGPETVMLSSAE
jgi:hypothetical protein